MLLLGLLMVAGCAPTCEQTCKKLADCDQVQASVEECTSACNSQQNLYQDWEDQDKIDAFDELKQCVSDHECAVVADGECYNPEIYIW
jgi:hypothetical protein